MLGDVLWWDLASTSGIQGFRQSGFLLAANLLEYQVPIFETENRLVRPPGRARMSSRIESQDRDQLHNI